jgi:hypothetical protein
MQSVKEKTTSEDIKRQLDQVLLSSVTELPTGNDGDPQKNTWKIASSVLSCGLYEFQGWAGGHGIRRENEDDFEENMFLLTYFSRNKNRFSGKNWSIRYLSGDNVANVGIPRTLSQFLCAGQNYLISGQTEWTERFKNFVTIHNLGVFREVEEFLNPNYLRHMIKVCVWTWNGQHPPLSAFPKYREV